MRRNLQLRLRVSCILGQMAVRPSKGSCTFAMAMQVERGSFGDVPLNGLTFIVLGMTPEEMGKGNWSVGLVIDERATAAARCDHRDCERRWRSMAPLSGLIGKFLGAEQAPIQIEQDGKKFTVTAGKLVDMAGEGAMGIDPNATEPMYSRTPVTRCRVVSRSHTRRRATSTPSDWRGTMRAGRTTSNTRPSIGGVHNQTLDPRPPTRIERALGHQRAASIVLLILLPLVCWSWIVVMARDMYGPMTGASAWMMTREWDAHHVFLLWAMWAVMMAGMMLPSAAPLCLLLYGAAARRRAVGRHATCGSTRSPRDT